MNMYMRSLIRRGFSTCHNLLKSNKKSESISKKVTEAYETIAYMGEDDLAMQQNFDQGRQFIFPSEHYLDRKRLLRNIPDEVDLFNLEDVDLEQIYGDLSKLDSDKSVQMKYYRKYLSNYSDQVVLMLQEFNGIDEKFKALRRNEIATLPLSPGSFYHKENLFNNIYNVVGFDKSLTGLPLFKSKGKSADTHFPKEFIEDLGMFKKKIKFHKRDLNFLSENKSSVNIDPRFLNKSSLSLDQNPNTMMEAMYKNEIPENTIQYDKVEKYELLPVFDYEILDAFEREIHNLRNFLHKDIKFEISKGNSSILLLANNEIKTNIFRLCEVVHTSDTNRIPSVVTIRYNFKEFNVFPNYTQIMNSKRMFKNLKSHLFKLFLINLELQLDTLLRLRYNKQEEINAFMKNLKSVINSTIDQILLPLCEKKIKKYRRSSIEAFYFKSNNNMCFKRIYWTNFDTYNLVSPRSKHYNKHKKGFLVKGMKLVDL